MIRNFYFDRLLAFCFLMLLILGVVFVFSGTYLPSLMNNKDPFFYLKRETLWALFALIFMFTAYLTPIELWKKISYPLIFITILLLITVLLFPAEIKGIHVKRWIDLGFIRFQPSELAKLSVILYIAYYIHRKESINGFLNRWSSLIAVISIPMIVAFLVLIQPHKGGGIFIAVLTFMLIFSSKFPVKKVSLFPLLIVPIFIFAVFTSDYAHKRIQALIDPVHNRTGVSYQVFQSILSFVKGGFTGEGIGGGTQKLKYLPEIHTDFIYALIGEETGFVGSLFVIILFLLILYRGLRISLDLEDTFSQVLGVGITYMIVLQAVFHMAVNVSLFPPTGFTLPFVSYGGSSLVVMSIGAGILLRLSKEPKITIYKRYSQ